MSQILLENARLFDGVNAECPEGISVLIDAGSIQYQRCWFIPLTL